MSTKALSRRTAVKAIGGAGAMLAAGIGCPAILKAEDKVKIGFLSGFDRSRDDPGRDTAQLLQTGRAGSQCRGWRRGAAARIRG